MFDRRFFAEAVTLVILAAICGSVANVVAARDRKLAWAGDYPNATVVPQRLTPAEPAATELDPPSAPETDPVMTSEAPATETGTEDPIPTTEADPATTSAAKEPVQPPAASAEPPVAKPAPKPYEPNKAFAPTPDKVSVDITNEDARQLFDQGVVFLDARRTGAFLEGHIPGARSFAVWEADIDDKVAALFYELPDQRQPIVVYCTGGNCEDSHMLAQKLWGIGYETVLVYTDGFPGWLSIGGPVER